MKSVSTICLFAMTLVIFDPARFTRSPESGKINASTYHLLVMSAGRWTEVSRIGTTPLTRIMFSHKGALYVGSSGNGIFRSTDLGYTWSSVNSGIPDIPQVGPLINSYVVSGGELFVGELGVYRLNPQGNGQRNDWISANNGLPTLSGFPLPVTSLVVSGTTLFVALSSPISPAPLIYRSRNQGENWELTAGELPTGAKYAHLAANDSTILASTNSHGVYRSTDQGQSWTLSNTGLEDSLGVLLDMVVLGSDFYASFPLSGFFRSTNQGLSWTKTSSWTTPSIWYSQLEAVGSNLLACSDGKIYLSTDQGRNWTLLNDGVTRTVFANLAIIGNQIYASSVGGKIYAGSGFLPNSLTAVSAASLSADSVAPDSIIAVFGRGLATGVAEATSVPCPSNF